MTTRHHGEHAAIVTEDLWQRVQMLLGRNGRNGGTEVRNKFGALLKGILHCAVCDCTMSPSHSTKGGNKRYRYYVCNGAQKRGWQVCPSKSIPAGEIERFVVEQIKCFGRDPALLKETLAQARRQGESELAALESERRGLERELARWNDDIRRLIPQVRAGEGDTPTIARLADLQERIRDAEQRATAIREEQHALSRSNIDQHEVAQALASFDPVWDSLTSNEQTRQLVVERIDYDGATGKVTITFHPSGIKTLGDELAIHNEENAA